MRTIKISEDVWLALQKKAVPLQDTPDDVLRRELHLEDGPERIVVSGRTTEQETKTAVNPKKEGDKNRCQYVESLRAKGIRLFDEKRTTRLTRNGSRVIILVANHPFMRSQWFLGVKKKLITEKPGTWLILVCLDGQQQFDFIVPPTQVVKLVGEVREVKGELKFSVFRNDGDFRLRRQGGGDVNLIQYLNNREELQRASV